jgi:ABC-type Na+ efflux pump permease subunit
MSSFGEPSGAGELGFLGLRGPLVGRLRTTLRDPFYRAEVRRGRGAGERWWPAGILLAMVIPYAWFAIPAIPALLVAESAFGERRAGTWEMLLLTPIDRSRLVWAKLLARLRPLLRATLIVPLLLAAAGAWTVYLLESVYAIEEFRPWRWGGLEVLLGALAGGLCGLAIVFLMAGECLTSGAFGLYFAARGRSRQVAYSLSVLAMLALHSLEVCVLGAIWAPLAPWVHGAAPTYWLVAGVATFWGLALLARTGLVNLLLPYGLMAHAANQLDYWVLREKGTGARPIRATG